MKKKRHISIAIAAIGASVLIGAVSSSSAATSIGASFIGRNATPADNLAPSDLAGVVPQTNWNNIADDGTTFKGTTVPLLDDSGNFTAVQIIYDCSDSWSSNGETTTPDQKLMKGIIKANPTPDTTPANNTDRMQFTITNLSAGSYNVFIYLMENDTSPTALAEADVIIPGFSTYEVEQESVFNAFVKATSTAGGDYQDANYVEYDGVAPDTSGTISITVAKNIVAPQLSDGVGVAGIQIVQVSGSALPPNTQPTSIIATNGPFSTNVIAGLPATFSVVATGPHKTQWQKGGADIAGAIGDTYTTPATTLADSGSQFVAVVFNNINTNTSAPATLTTHVNTDPVAITANPASTLVIEGQTASFNVSFTGPLAQVQWQKNNVDIAGATNASYTTPATVLADNGATFRAIVFNNVSTNTSTAATLSVDANIPPTLTQGFLKVERWENIGGATGAGGLSDLETNIPGSGVVGTAPNTTFYEPGPNVPQTNPDISNFGARVWGWVKPDVTGDYDFFTRSDDPSQVFLNSTAAASGTNTIPDVHTATPICQELACCNPFQAPGNPQTTATPIHLEAGKLYGFVAIYKEGGGNDFVQVAWRMSTDTTPPASLLTIPAANCYTLASPAGQRVSITTQPQSAVVQQGRDATFTVGVTTFPVAGVFSVAWQTNGTIVSGASGTTLTLPAVVLAQNGMQVKAQALTLAGLTNSAVATLTVVNDTNPPVLLAAGAFSGTSKIGLTFDEDLDAASAGLASNYKVNGAAVTSVLVRTNVANETTTEKNLVSVTVATPVTADFTVTVVGVKDLLGNTMASSTVQGHIINLTLTDIGSPAGQPGGPDPLAPSTVTTWGPSAFDVLCNGNDYWNNADGFSFLWVPKTNSFDVKVRVVSVSPIDNWSAGAIEVREGPTTPTGGGWELARHYFCKVDYAGPDVCIDNGSSVGANTYEFNSRLARGNPTIRETGATQNTANAGDPVSAGSSYGWMGAAGPAALTPVPFPNAWIRIARVKSVSNNVTNDHLLGYNSRDGKTWALAQDVNLLDGTHAGWLTGDGTGTNTAGPLPDVLYVGLGSTCHTGIGNGNATNLFDGAGEGFGEFPYSPGLQPFMCYVIYRDWGDTTPTVVTNGPTLSFVLNANGTISLTYTGNLYSSDTANGTFALVSGATSPFIANPSTSGKKTQFFRAGP